MDTDATKTPLVDMRNVSIAFGGIKDGRALRLPGEQADGERPDREIGPQSILRNAPLPPLEPGLQLGLIRFFRGPPLRSP